MKDLSVTQEYLLCVLGKRGSVSLDIFKIAGLAAGGVLELLMEDILTFDEKKLSIRTSLPWEKEYLRPIYELIQQKQPIKVEKIAEEFSCTLTNKRAKQLIESIGDSLEEAGYARKEISGIFGSKVRYFPDPQGMDAVVQKIRAEILEDGPISEETVALASLLNKSGNISRYFSPYEKKQLKDRIKEIRDTPESRIVKQMLEYVEALIIAAT